MPHSEASLRRWPDSGSGHSGLGGILRVLAGDPNCGEGERQGTGRERTSRAPLPTSARFVSGAHTGPHSRACWFSLPLAGARPSSQHSLASALGPPWEGLRLPLSTLRCRRNEGPLLELKTGLVMVPCGKLPGWGLSPMPLSNRPRSVTPALGLPRSPKAQTS